MVRGSGSGFVRGAVRDSCAALFGVGERYSLVVVR